MCVSLVPHRALINCARPVTFEEVLTGVSASEPSSRPPFSPLLPRRLIYRSVFYESCSSPPLISRRRSDGARQKRRGRLRRSAAKSSPVKTHCAARSSRLTHRCFCGFKVFHPSTFFPPPSCLRSAGEGREVIPPLESAPQPLPMVAAFQKDDDQRRRKAKTVSTAVN